MAMSPVKSEFKTPKTFDRETHAFIQEGNWIDIQKVVPVKNKIVEIRMEIWRYGKFVEEEIVEVKYIGWNGIIGQPMFEWKTHDEYFMKVKYWKHREHDNGIIIWDVCE